MNLENDIKSSQTIEDRISQVYELGRDLSAEIIIKDEIGHWESTCTHSYYNNYCEPGDCPDRWVVDQPKITEPDREKRQLARTQLTEIYNESDLYCTRFLAGRALDKSPEELASKINLWVNELGLKLWDKAPLDSLEDLWELWIHTDSTSALELIKKTYRKSCEAQQYFEHKIKESASLTVERFADSTLTEAGYHQEVQLSSEIVNLAIDFYSYSKSEYLKKILENCYHHNPKHELRVKAGKTLGYSKSKIFVHENSESLLIAGAIAATIAGLAAIIYAGG